jgi:hypothetical protein
LRVVHCVAPCKYEGVFKNTTKVHLVQTFDVAHIQEQGVDLIVVFVDRNVQYMTDAERAQIQAGLAICARSAGLAGSIVLYWDGGFFCDRRFHAFFETTPPQALAASINRKLTCQNL